MSQKRILLSLLLFALVLLWSSFIFSNSMEDVSASYETSARFIRLIDSRLLEDPDTYILAQNFFRKAAHFFEFFMLGILFYFLFSRLKKPAVPAFLFSVLAAFLDEGLQMFSDRGNSLRDVALDSCGAAVGVLLMIVFSWGFRRRKSRKQTGKHP